MARQRWHPDTCACVIDEDVDGDNQKTLAAVARKCQAHAALSDVLDAEAPDSPIGAAAELAGWKVCAG